MPPETIAAQSATWWLKASERVSITSPMALRTMPVAKTGKPPRVVGDTAALKPASCEDADGEDELPRDGVEEPGSLDGPGRQVERERARRQIDPSRGCEHQPIVAPRQHQQQRRHQQQRDIERQDVGVLELMEERQHRGGRLQRV